MFGDRSACHIDVVDPTDGWLAATHKCRYVRLLSLFGYDEFSHHAARSMTRKSAEEVVISGRFGYERHRTALA